MLSQLATCEKSLLSEEYFALEVCTTQELKKSNIRDCTKVNVEHDAYGHFGEKPPDLASRLYLAVPANSICDAVSRCMVRSKYSLWNW